MGAEDLGQIALQGLSMGGGFGGAFFALRWFALFIADRKDKREEQLDADTRFVVEQLKDQVTSLMEKVRRMDEELDECRRGHAERDAEIMQLRAMMQGYGDARQEAARIVAMEKRASK